MTTYDNLKNERDNLKAEIEIVNDQLMETELRALKFIHQFNAACDLGRELRIALRKIADEGDAHSKQIAIEALKPFEEVKEPKPVIPQPANYTTGMVIIPGTDQCVWDGRDKAAIGEDWNGCTPVKQGKDWK